MDYSLALELKNAGFQHSWMCDAMNDNKLLDHPPSFPTLEELIEACGDKFSYLVYDITWRAFAKGDMQNGEVRGHYNTPTEAVARLWLALNKKA